MKSELEIQQRIDSLKSRISELESKYQNQMSMNFRERDNTLIRFLLEEQSTYRLALSQLTWVLDNVEQ